MAYSLAPFAFLFLFCLKTVLCASAISILACDISLITSASCVSLMVGMYSTASFCGSFPCSAGGSTGGLSLDDLAYFLWRVSIGSVVGASVVGAFELLPAGLL